MTLSLLVTIKGKIKFSSVMNSSVEHIDQKRE